MLSVLACGKPVSYTRAVRLLDPRRHTLYSLGDTPFVLVVSAPIPPAEAVCADVHEEVLDRLLREAEREMRSRHLPERRKPWSPTKTKAPLADADAKRARSPTLEDYLKVAEEVVEKLGDPWNPSRRGRKPLYSPKKLAAALIVKEFRGMSFETLSSELREAGYDARTEEAKRKGDGAKSPCPSHLHWVLTKIPEEYLERALRLLDRMVAEKHARLFGTEHLHEYSVDSTEDRCDTLEEVEVAMETQLHHETVGVQRAHQACDQHRGGRQGLREHEGRETPPEARAAGFNGLHGPRSTTPRVQPASTAQGGESPSSCALGSTTGNRTGAATATRLSRGSARGGTGAASPGGEAHREQGGPRRGHAELPEAGHAEKGTHPQVHSPQHASVLHAAGLAGTPEARPNPVSGTRGTAGTHASGHPIRPSAQPAGTRRPRGAAQGGEGPTGGVTYPNNSKTKTSISIFGRALSNLDFLD